ncbi:hypothetical protein K474DRAFT_1106672 [Panus rudis PR-1116 ss-1]|nr:hypothetical protein K474DRAFT_1106672 [Panus rudis PR-1116 ss-1]
MRSSRSPCLLSWSLYFPLVFSVWGRGDSEGEYNRARLNFPRAHVVDTTQSRREASGYATVSAIHMQKCFREPGQSQTFIMMSAVCAASVCEMLAHRCFPACSHMDEWSAES